MTLLPTATHNKTDGHETSLMPRNRRSVATFQAPTPPVGWVEERILPGRSTAMHSAREGHETAMSPPGKNGVDLTFTMWALVHARAPPLGWLDARMFPAASTATHSDRDGHERALRVLSEPEPSMCARRHPPRAG